MPSDRTGFQLIGGFVQQAQEGEGRLGIGGGAPPSLGGSRGLVLGSEGLQHLVSVLNRPGRGLAKGHWM